MSDPRLYKIADGNILSCKLGDEKCETLPRPKDCATPKEVQVKDGELFAICEDANQKTALSHYFESGNSWEDFSYHLTSCYMSGMDLRCNTTYRYPMSLREEDGFLIVDLDNGESSRAPISPDNMAAGFVAHSKKIDADTVEEALEDIGSFTNVLGGYNRGSLGLSDRWEKKQAIMYLRAQLEAAADPIEQQNIQSAIEQLSAQMENDRIVFQVEEPIDDGQYCNGTSCLPILTPEPHYRHMDVSTELATPAVPLHRNIEISDEQWGYVTAPLLSDTGSASTEREALREVTRRWELVLSSKIGTGADVGGWMGNLVGFIPILSLITGQTSCNEETTNNIGLVYALQTAGFLRYHSVDYAMPLATLYGMHQSVLFKEKATGEKYVLDSWPMGNGRLPIVQKEADWNFLTTMPYNNFPSYEGWKEGHPFHRAATDLIWFELLRRNARKQFRLRNFALGFAMPGEQRYFYFNDPRNAWGLNKYKTDYATWPYPPFGDTRHGGSVIRKDFKHLLPESFVGPKTRFERSYHDILVSRTPIANPFEYATLNYLKTARGALTVGGMLFFAADILMIPLSGKPDGIPDSSPGVDIHEQILSYAGAIYLGAEGALAISVGEMPAIYELGVALLPMMGGSIAGSVAANELGEWLGIDELKHDEPLNQLISILGGLLAVLGARKIVGEEAWTAASKRFETFVLNTVGRAGMYVEDKAMPAALRKIAAIRSRSSISVPVVKETPALTSGSSDIPKDLAADLLGGVSKKGLDPATVAGVDALGKLVADTTLKKVSDVGERAERTAKEVRRVRKKMSGKGRKR